MPMFRKKPVVIEAMPFDGTEASASEIVEWIGPQAHPPSFHPAYPGEHRALLMIHTLEGTMTASPGDWVIKGVSGEFYPCKPDIFEATYEPA
jgi:hypothetical protein